MNTYNKDNKLKYLQIEFKAKLLGNTIERKELQIPRIASNDFKSNIWLAFSAVFIYIYSLPTYFNINIYMYTYT